MESESTTTFQFDEQESAGGNEFAVLFCLKLYGENTNHHFPYRKLAFDLYRWIKEKDIKLDDMLKCELTQQENWLFILAVLEKYHHADRQFLFNRFNDNREYTNFLVQCGAAIYSLKCQRDELDYDYKRRWGVL
jgi:hypothetical protein